MTAAPGFPGAFLSGGLPQFETEPLKQFGFQLFQQAGLKILLVHHDGGPEAVDQKSELFLLD